MWWRGLEDVVELNTGDEKGIGAIRRFTWKTCLPYKLTFEMETTQVEPFALLDGVAKGELEGKGVWRFSPRGPSTSVRYDWNVRTTKTWMNFLALILRPLFKWNHDLIMHWGRQGLKFLLENPVGVPNRV